MRLFLVLALLPGGRAVSWIFEDIFLELLNDSRNVLFPPSRLTVHVCVDPDDAIKLSRLLSGNLLSHRIRNTPDEFDATLYDPYDHGSLYIFDMACANVFDTLRMASLNRLFVAPTKWLLLQDRRIPDSDNATSQMVYADIIDKFEDMAVYPDSDVVLATRFQDFLEITSIYRPSPVRSVILEDRGSWRKEDGLRMRTHDVASRRRRNLHLTPIKSCIVVSDPIAVNHPNRWNSSADTVARISYAWLEHLVDRMNATLSFVVETSWGYESENGSWSGMVGMLHRREIDMGGTATFLTEERIEVVQYIQLPMHISVRFIFRKPLLSSISNIFTLPFHRKVWIAIGIVLLLVLTLLYFSAKWEFHRSSSSSVAKYLQQANPTELSFSDNILVILGAITQQGYSYEPYRVPSRIVTLMLLTATLSLYAAYTANIVALLQSTTDHIKTPADLLHSPLKLAVRDAPYYRHFFKSFKDPVRKAIADKVNASGGGGWLTVQEGTRRIKNELFAFFIGVEVSYKIMEDTYQEDEKCGLSEIDILNLFDPLWVVQKRSPYLEIIKNGALLLRETGLKYRAEYTLHARKPKCAGQTNYINIGLTECYFPLVTMGYGISCAIGVFLLEVLWYKRQEKKRSDEQKAE